MRCMTTEDRVNLIAAAAFTIGGSLFALGAAVAELGSGDAIAPASIYLVGGVFFSTGGYVSVLQVIDPPARERWRWWAWETQSAAWVSAAVLFAGTLVFGVNLIDSFIEGLTVQQENRLIWAPDMVGCILFLVSGHVALAQVCRGRRVCWRPRRNDWWVAILNQVGSYFFLVSGLAAYINPETSNPVNEAVANWGTFAGAICFALGGVVQGFGGVHHRERHASAIAAAAAQRDA